MIGFTKHAWKKGVDMADAALQQKTRESNSASLRVAVAIACALTSFLATNGSIYPAIVAFDPWIREWATLFGVVVLAALVTVARHRPKRLHPGLFNALALASVGGYLALDGAGFALGDPALLLTGSLLDSLAESWLFVLAYVAFAQLDAVRRPVVAMAACLAAYLLQPLVTALEAPHAVAANALCFILLFVCVRSLAANPLREARCSEPQAEMAVANPQSFLPTNHLLFVTVFVFSIAQGLVIALPGPFNDASALPASFIPLAAILAIYLIRRRMPNADGLFALCALLIIAGMFLQPSDRLVSAGIASASNTLIEAGASCFNLLLVLLVGSIAGRNRVMALPTAALMLALYWSGVGVGAILGNSAMGMLGWTETALVWTSFASAMVFITFCFIVLKRTSFADAIGSIRPPEPLRTPLVDMPQTALSPDSGTRPLRISDAEPEPHIDQASLRREAVSNRFGLTPRETDVFELLAQGRTVGVIREKLYISLNTARFHTKNVYAKLGVHSQQELIDLVENFSPVDDS